MGGRQFQKKTIGSHAVGEILVCIRAQGSEGNTGNLYDQGKETRYTVAHSRSEFISSSQEGECSGV